MPNQFTYNPEIKTLLNVVLNGKADVTYAVAHYCLFNTFVKRGFGYPAQFHYFFADIAERESIGCITKKTVPLHTTIHRYDVAIVKNDRFRRNAVYYLLIDGNTKGGWKATISFKCRYCTVIANQCLSSGINLFGGNTWTNDRGYMS